MYTQVLFLSALVSLSAAQSFQELLNNNNSTLSSFNNLLTADPNLLATLSNATNITVLAPSNDALAGLNTQGVSQADINALLTYHVLNGTYRASVFNNDSQFIVTSLNDMPYTSLTAGQVVNAQLVNNNATLFSGLGIDSEVVTPDLTFTNGILHIISKPLTIPISITSTALDLNLTSLYGALNATNLSNAVDSLANCTIFAPSNSAFGNIGSLVPSLSTEQLTEILSYHVVNGTVGYSTLLSNGSELTTLGGGTVKVTEEEGGVLFVNSARVVTANVLVGNGVVHVIDNVLNPNATTLTPTGSNTASQAPAFTSASSASDGITPFTTGVPTATTTVSNVVSTGTQTQMQTGIASSSSSSAGAQRAMQTGAGVMGVGAATLFGAGAWLVVGL